MYWETLPNWVWIIYYTFIIATLVAAIISIVRKKLMIVSILTIILAMTLPIISIINSIGREKGVDEFEHFITQLQQGFNWPIFVIVGFFYLFVWWAVYLINNKKKDVSY